MAKKKSTAAFLKSFMESDARMQGLKQAFIMYAVELYANECILNVKENNPWAGFCSDELWQSIAEELNLKLKTEYK